MRRSIKMPTESEGTDMIHSTHTHMNAVLGNGDEESLKQGATISVHTMVAKIRKEDQATWLNLSVTSLSSLPSTLSSLPSTLKRDERETMDEQSGEEGTEVG